MPEWLKGMGCKPIGIAYVGSNPTAPIAAGGDGSRSLTRLVPRIEAARDGGAVAPRLLRAVERDVGAGQKALGAPLPRTLRARSDRHRDGEVRRAGDAHRVRA